MNAIAKINNLSHKYDDVVALSNIILEIPSGSMVGFIGPDGVGKSTLLSIIAGVKKIQTGEVEVMGGDIKSKNYRNSICSKIAYMPQGLGKNLYMSLTVFENIDFFARLFGQEKSERLARIDELLKSTGLEPFKDRAVGKLSGGMKQKLGLCCALIHEPDLLILDEPTTGVDPLSRQQFWKLIERIQKRREGMNVLIATAYMQEAMNFDYLVAMDEGKILTTGSPKEILIKTNSDNLDNAFIELLPIEKRKEHKNLTLSPYKQREKTFAIEAKNLTMKFGDFIAVDHVNFQIKKGEIFGFLGSNGCGKTTTMKMLTGLLTPSEGKAWLFGEETDSNNITNRKRVGYMTQNFSLYSELTIKQNLSLHAKLFHISDKENRVKEMLEKFSLKRYENSLASDLPLGIKQRLSLAVAVIHKPEMLILDEPTSGVDPISRDNFWKLLIELSRNDSVTIFISTHFMNEGERCDRISLMHQGKVLDSDSPKALIEKRKKNNLEEAFIDYLEEVIEVEKIEEFKLNSGYKKSETKNFLFSMTRFLGYSYRESLELIRDPIRLIFALFGIVILMFAMGYGITLDVEDMHFSALDYDKSPQSRAYIQNISGSRYFLEHSPIHSHKELDKRIKSGELSLAIEIPPNFGKNLLASKSVEVGVWINGSMPFRAETMKGYILGMHYDYLQKLAQNTLGYSPSLTLANIELRYRYNQDFKSIYAMVPAVIPMLLIFIPSIMMTLSIVREKELGSITNFYATPTTRLEFLLGKQLPYIVLSMISFFALIALTLFIFHVPIKGNFLILTIATLLYIIVTTGFGLLISAFAKTQIAGLATTAILTLLPTINFSGLKDPISSLEGVAFIIGNIFPTTYFINISRGIFSKSVSFDELYIDFLALIISIFVITTLSVVVLKKQEK